MNKKELIFVALLLICFSVFGQQIPLSARLTGGKIHFQGGRFEKALQQFELALKDNPGSPEARFWKALTLEKLGKFLEASVNFDTTFTQAPEWLDKAKKDPIYQYSSWNAFIKAGQKMDQESQFGPAITFYKRSTEIDPQNSQGYLLLSNVYIAIDSFTKVNEMADTLLVLNPNNVQAFILKGVYFSNKPDWDSSMIYYDKAINAFKQDWDVVKNVIGKELKIDTAQATIVAVKLIEFRKEKKLEMYISDSLKAKSKYLNIAKLTEQLSMDQSELNLCNFRAGTSAYQKVNLVKEDSIQQKYIKTAVDYFLQALRFNTLDFDTRYNLGMAYYRAGQDAKAESTYQDLVQMSMIPVNAFSEKLSQSLIELITKENLKLGYLEISDTLTKEIDKEIADKKIIATGYWYLYYWNYKQDSVLPKKYNKDSIYISGLTTDAVENLWLFLGGTQISLKKFDNAIKSFNSVLALNPKNLDALRNLSVCYREKGDKIKSYEYYEQWDKLNKQQK